MKTKSLLILLLMISSYAIAQKKEKQFTHADTLRGTINAEREWWDVLRYDITVEPDFESKSITGNNRITYKTVKEDHPLLMQIDLQEPLLIDSIIFNKKKPLSFTREGNAWHIKTEIQGINSVNEIVIFYHGKPREAVRPPWDGGWTFTKDSLDRPWMTVTSQGLGASVWYPNKDHQSDEPNDGASLRMIVPNDLVAVSNGRLKEKTAFSNSKTSYTWVVENPINNYNITPYIGKYVNFSETYLGLKGELDLNYWVMDYNLEKARNYLPNEVHNMLDSFEYWFGPYPFYEDGYKLVETEHTGMEHQSAVAYGNYYKPGYRGRDLSGTGWGMKWDFIVVHESGHEWFGNNITSNDLAEMYLHESFTNYSETLFVDSMFGKEAANEYNYGIRQGIQNKETIIPAAYGVNAQGSGDMYPKGGNMLHSIRHSINNDQLFRNILAGLNQTFYHQTVDGSQIQEYISKKAGYDYKNVFNQYLTTTQIPELIFYLNAENEEVFYKWTNCIDGFDLPLSLNNSEESLKIIPTQKWQSIKVNKALLDLFDPKSIEKNVLYKGNGITNNELLKNELMFSKDTYISRRKSLKTLVHQGIIFFPGNGESGMNYRDNWYPFRQDSTFLYYTGINNIPDICFIIDVDNDEEILFGDDPTPEEMVWTGAVEPLAEFAEKSGIGQVKPLKELSEFLKPEREKGQRIHYLPPYRGDTSIQIGKLLGIPIHKVEENKSEVFIKAVVQQRSIKSSEEITELEKAVNITAQMHLHAIKNAVPGRSEKEIAGELQAIAIAGGGNISFPIILTRNGQYLHNHATQAIIQEGDIILCDCGAETSMNYAGDMTRTFPAGKSFSTLQKEVYNIVLNAHNTAIEALKPGVLFKDVHLLACTKIAQGLKDMGLMKGDMNEAVANGAHTLFFQCGLGHFMGMDVHDMENLGENYVGYNDEIRKSDQFGLKSLRLGKALEQGNVLTVEPGIYFNPFLIDSWEAQKKHVEFVNYDEVKKFKNFGGIRVEEDFLITASESRLLGKPLAKSPEDIEKLKSL